MYSARELRALRERMDNRGSRRAVWGGKDPERPLWRGRIRTEMVPPPGDAFLTRAEAAMILGVKPVTVSAHARNGRLFVWQREPGKQNCPVYFSANQVYRLSRDPNRLERRARYLKSLDPEWKKVRGGSPKQSVEQAAFRERYGLPAVPEKVLKRNHGEYYSTSQAADVLNVSRSTLGGMRRRGILKGYRSPNSKEAFNRRRWWFYLKSEVEGLKGSFRHQRKRRAYWKARMPWAYEEDGRSGVQAFGRSEEEWYPHEVDHSPSAAAKMKLEMSLNTEN